MTLQVHKTEEQFRDVLDQELPELPGKYTRFQVGNALIRALDLEFQEPEGRGKDPVREFTGELGELALDSFTFQEGRKLGTDRQQTGAHFMVSVEPRVREFLQEQQAALLGLARELESRLRKHHARHGEVAAPGTTYDLLDRARAILEPLQRGRE